MDGSLRYFFNVFMSAFVFFIIYSAEIILLGSYPNLMIRSSKDFIFVSLVREEILSSFNYA